ncbi:MAG: UDP-N-acetylglucosamine 2-epimerase [Pseudomonadota bacterium]
MTERRRIAVLTTARSDFCILRPVLSAMREVASLQPLVIAGGAHLSPRFGSTWADIPAAGFEISAKLDFLGSGDRPSDIAHSMARALELAADSLADLSPDVLVVLGDRWETLAVASAAAVLGTPIAHLHGGELSIGAIDDCFRHAITKLSHLHFVATEAYAARVRQLGEEEWRITVCGAPGLDNLKSQPILPPAALSEALGTALPERFILATLHPVTTLPGSAGRHVSEFLSALDAVGRPVVFTLAGADAGGDTINAAIAEFVTRRTDCRVVASFGAFYASALAAADAMVGNSSSGIIEAASFRLPVVNVGPRQDGRDRGGNVIDCGHESAEIAAALCKALEPGFRDRLEAANPYDQGGAAAIIATKLAEAPLGPHLLTKRFVDQPGGA